MLCRIVPVIVLLAAGGCATSSQSLDNGRAIAVLSRSLPAARPFFRFVDGMAAADDPPERGVYTALERAGIVRSYTAISLLDAAPQCHYRLTPHGASLAPGWRRLEHGVYEIRIGTVRLAQVTGVEMLAPRHAMVRYAYRLELNAMGALLERYGRGDLAYFDPVQSRVRDLQTADHPTAVSVEMSLFDDGWRSENASI